ncbi:MAG: T9SS type A sorting domain-containing protein [Paludibacteraceae bacterium]|nr:T9SS type A sorting domain-containing protein [Paludibacteraceae bacterium]
MSLCALNSTASVFLTEVSINQSNPYVELFNNSIEDVSVKKWTLECGENQKILQDSIIADSLIVMDLEPSFFNGSAIVLRDEKGSVVDHLILDKNLFKYNSITSSLQRDSITISGDGSIIEELSAFSFRKQSKGEINSLKIEDRSVLNFSYNENTNELVGQFPVRIIDKFNENIVCHTIKLVAEEGKTLIAYPNPIETELNISSKGLDNTKYSILSTNGKIMKTGVIEFSLTKIDMSHLASGIYYLVIDEGEKKYTLKLSKL